MNVIEAFDRYQKFVNADDADLRLAKERRDIFKTAFEPEADVVEVIRSGSLARGTQRDPIHDVDMIVVFDGESHQDWGQPGQSAADALDLTRGRIAALLGTGDGSVAREVRRALPRNHAVKCFLDDPDDESGFTVDVTPALEFDGMLSIPEKRSACWVPTNPAVLTGLVEARHAEWDKYAGTVRMLKAWTDSQPMKVKSLVMEVLATEYLPLGKSRAIAIRNFFAAAAFAIENGQKVSDPANVSGEIQADLDYEKFAVALRASAEAADAAISKQIHNDNHGSISLWGDVFGDGFPAPPVSGGDAAGAGTVGDTPRRVKDTPQG